MTDTAWAEAIGAEVDDSGLPTQATIRGHIRAAATGPYLLRSRIVRALKESYAPLRCDEPALQTAIHDACTALVRLGELTEFQTDGGPGYVATPERLVALDDETVVILGMADGSSAPTDRSVRRLAVKEVQEIAESAPLVSLADELGPAAWRLHLVASGGSDDVAGGPIALFDRLAGAAAGGERMERTGPDGVRVLSKRGAFFGQPRAAKPEGRWTALSGDGTFCAVRQRSYGWRTCIVSANSNRVTAIDVEDLDRWRWAVVGQTLMIGDPVAEFTSGEFRALAPPPFQIQRLLDLAGDSVAPWRWRLNDSSAELALQLLGQSDY